MLDVGATGRGRLRHRARAARARRAERRPARRSIRCRSRSSTPTAPAGVREEGAGRARPASADGPLRWIANGKTILNNKGKPVKQYEPYFSRRAVTASRTPQASRRHAGHVLRRAGPAGAHRVAGRHASAASSSRRGSRSFDRNDTVLEAAGNAIGTPRPRDRCRRDRRAARSQARRRARSVARRAARRHAGRDPLRQPRPRGHRHRAQPPSTTRAATRRSPRAVDGRALPDVHQARRRRQAAVDPRCARQPGDAVHHAAQADHTPLYDESRPTTSRPTTCRRTPCPATTSPATCCSSTAWTPATAGC